MKTRTALALVALAAAATACTPTATRQVTAPAAAPVAHASSPPKSPVAHVGATLQLAGASGSMMGVTLTQVIDPAQGASQFDTPDGGKRFVATVFTLRDTGTSAVSGDANGDASVIGTDTQSYSPDFDSVAECTNFNNGSFALGAGESVSGCVVFQLPTGVNVAKVQWAPSEGVASDFGQWLVP